MTRFSHHIIDSVDAVPGTDYQVSTVDHSIFYVCDDEEKRLPIGGNSIQNVKTKLLFKKLKAELFAEEAKTSVLLL